ncbi:hypothetical protein CLOM_g5069 [Closterium sp. NIES-68]|nr:hypothetical protein CLOM_g5069 [Closterium sp. NIES-68]GJP64523.1 hypothetical protein CLOP_g21499 [Closterium sp. NIES-67]
MASDCLREHPSSSRGASFNGGSMRDLVGADLASIKDDRSASRGNSCGCGALEASVCICSKDASSPVLSPLKDTPTGGSATTSSKRRSPKPSSSFRFFASFGRSVQIEIPDDGVPQLPVSQSLPEPPTDSAALNDSMRDPRSTLELFHSASQPPLWQPSSPVGVRSRYAEAIRQRARRAMESAETMDSAWEDLHVAQVAQSTPTSPCRSPSGVKMVSPKSLRRMLLSPAASRKASSGGEFSSKSEGKGRASGYESRRRSGSLRVSVDGAEGVDWSGELLVASQRKQQLASSPKMTRNLTIDVRYASESADHPSDLDFFSSEWAFPVSQSMSCVPGEATADSPPDSPTAAGRHSCMPAVVSSGLRIISSSRSPSLHLPSFSSLSHAAASLSSPRSPSLHLPSLASLAHPSPRSKGKPAGHGSEGAHAYSGPLSPQVSRQVPAWESEEVAAVRRRLPVGVGEIAIHAPAVPAAAVGVAGRK